MATAVSASGDEDVAALKEKAALPLVDPFIGNVSNYVASPSDHEGSPVRGHLIFNACFEGGNLGKVDRLSEFEYDLYIRPDSCNPRFRVWFHFSVANTKSEQRVIFNVVNFSKTKSLYREGMSPLVKSTSRPRWQRIPPKNVFYYHCPDHLKNYIMSFAFAFDREDDSYEFAYSYPYTYTHLQQYLERIEANQLDYFKRELLCLTVQQRRLDLVTIASPENLQRSHSKIVFMTARVHPGETPSSYVCQGLIDFLISKDAVAEVLRDNIIFKIIPMLNPDGVFLGNYRCSLMGFDLNRHWHEPSPWAHPTLQATKALVLKYNADPNIDLDFYIDIHAHSTLMNGFMYGNVYEDIERFDLHSVFPKLLCANAQDFSMLNTSFNQDAVKAGTGRRFLGNCLNPCTNCYTLEVSFFSYTTGSPHSSPAPYTEEGYFRLGHNVARTFLDYYHLHHLLPPSIKRSPSKHNEQSLQQTQGRRTSADLSDDKFKVQANNSSTSEEQKDEPTVSVETFSSTAASNSIRSSHQLDSTPVAKLRYSHKK